MPVIAGSRPNLSAGVTQGIIKKNMAELLQVRSKGSNFMAVIVLDVICDPTEINENKIQYWRNILRVSNIDYAQHLPRNSVIAKIVGKETAPLFLFPFFPSHLSLPCKPGEMVWGMIENPDDDYIDQGFWICKVMLPHFCDDVNHTHPVRVLELESGKGYINTTDNNSETLQIYELRNGKRIVADRSNPSGKYHTSANSQILKTDDELYFEKFVTDSHAASISQWEAVPRFKKRPGDIALEGSNNTLIVLGTDRVGPHANYELTANGPSPSFPPGDLVSGSAGSIDIVSGRGQTQRTLGNIAKTTSIFYPPNNEPLEIKREIAKTPDMLVKNEGDPDFINDRSRILISQRTKVDNNFALKNYNETNFVSNAVQPDQVTGTTATTPVTPLIQDSVNGDAAIVIKSDKVRLIARSDLQILVTGFSNTTQENYKNAPLLIKNESTDTSNWASMTIKTNGDIVFTPSQQGVIKLGGDDADKAILCTSVVAPNVTGSIKPTRPIGTTAGGFIGTTGGLIDQPAINLERAPDFGTFASKILVK